MTEKKRRFRWRDLPLAVKVLFQVVFVAIILFSTNLLIYWQVNKTMQSLDNVYASNVNLTELAESLEAVQSAQSIALEHGNQKIEQVHLGLSLVSSPDGLIPQLLQ